MKRILGLALLGTLALGDSLHITGGAFSKHKDSNMNGTHNWIGAEYKFYKNNGLELGVEVANFKNSFNDNTKMIAVNATYFPFVYNRFEFGVAAAIGYQEGYCIKDFEAVECKVGDENTSLMFLPSVAIKANNLILDRDLQLNITKIDQDYMGRFMLELAEW